MTEKMAFTRSKWLFWDHL